MKKYLVILATAALATSAFAQGTITFANDSRGLVKQWTSATDHTLISVPKSSSYVQLFAAPTTASLTPIGAMGTDGYSATYTTIAAFLAANNGWNSIATTAIFPVAGNFSGGGKTIENIAAGANAQYFLVGWNGAAGSTYDSALAAGTGFIGVSATFTTLTGNPNALPVPGSPVSLADSFTGMTLASVGGGIVPEPSTFALAGLGAAALLIFRRRK